MYAEHKAPLAAEQAQDGAVGSVLAEHAAAIKTLGKRVVTDVFEIGRRLDECKRSICGHGGFLPWLGREFGWSDKTAENFINVYKLGSKFENVSSLNLPLSGLYMLAAPSTPDEVRTEIIERAQTGEPVSVAEIRRTIDTAKGRRQSRSRISAIFRTMKLGEDTIAKIRGTALDNARELDALVYLNRGASEGELTEPVQDLVALAGRGEKVSAITYTKSGAAFRCEKVTVSNSATPKQAHDDISPDSAGETTPHTPIEEVEARLKHAESQNIALRSQVRELSRALEGKFAAAPDGQFLAEFQRRLSPQFLKKHHAAIKAAIARALDASGRHNGPVLDLQVTPVDEVTKH